MSSGTFSTRGLSGSIFYLSITMYFWKVSLEFFIAPMNYKLFSIEASVMIRKIVLLSLLRILATGFFSAPLLDSRLCRPIRVIDLEIVPISVIDLLTDELPTEDSILLFFMLLVMAFLMSSELLVFLRNFSLKKKSSVLLDMGSTLSKYSVLLRSTREELTFWFMRVLFLTSW